MNVKIDCLNDPWGETDCEKRPLRPDENPTILDEIIFKFKTTKTGELCANCCDQEDELCTAECIDPYKFDNITIYFIERNFSNTKAYSDDNFNVFYYTDATVVAKIGDEDYPAWLSTDPDNSYIKKISQDKDGNVLTGCFEYVWNPVGLREGDYFICWTYTPYAGGASISSHLKFYLNSSSEINTSIPTHRTNPKKYYDLLERYTPEMFKEYISEKDRTPDVLDKLNKSISKGFNVLEDLTNQMVDLLDSNAVNEYIIYYLSNTLNLKLKSSDPTLWRRQIKEAVPLYKTKGTIKALKDSLEQSGMRLLRVSNYWQFVSPFYFVDSFIVELSNIFNLTYNLANNDLEVSYFSLDNVKNVISSSDYELIEEEYLTKIKINIDLPEKTIITVRYCYKQPQNQNEQNLSDYIQALPLMDNRDQYSDQEIVYPLKNWNVRLIDENDPLIHQIVTSRHPFQKDVIFGKIRTEFPYSENVYNSEEYNGSLRDSLNPCDIDLDFIDKCSSCRSSNFDVDIEIQSLSDDRIQEAKEVITENVPFHSVLRTINFFGGNYEYVTTPIESCDILLTYKYLENNISGDLQRWFYRSKLDIDQKNRSELAEKSLSFSENLYLYNDKIVLFCPNFNFEELNFYQDRYVEILSPSVYSGIYSINNPNKNYVDINIQNLVNDSTFSFNVFDEITSFSADLIRDDYIELLEEDNKINFIELGINNQYKVLINSISYEVKQVLSPNKIILKNNSNIIKSNFSSNYKVLDEDNEEVALKGDVNFSFGKFLYYNLTRVNRPLELSKEMLKNFEIQAVFEKIVLGIQQDYVCKIVDYDNDGFFINNYYDEDAGSLLIKIRYILRKNELGNLVFSGIKAESTASLDQTFIDNISEYSIKIVSQNFNNNYYFISDVVLQNGKYILSLYGDFERFGLYNNKVLCNAQFFNYKEKQISIEDNKNNLPEINMEINRSNKSIIEKDVENDPPLKASNDDSFFEFNVQKENIFVKIETINGETVEEKL